jgi:hypothetical protein
MGEILFIMAMVIPTVIAGVFKFWGMFWMCMAINVTVGIVEVLSVKITGKTISQQFWWKSKTKKVKAMIILGSLAVYMAALIYHLGYKMFQ